jgi:hypothetical protein
MPTEEHSPSLLPDGNGDGAHRKSENPLLYNEPVVA